MPQTPAELLDCRTRIDSIDDQLIALLKARIAIVNEVGHIKRHQGETGLYVRSGREGSMLRRITNAFAGTDFHPAAAAAMWRQLIGASIHHESPLELSVPSEPASLYWLAREHFGSFVSTHFTSNNGQAIANLFENKGNIAILPYPDNEQNWWTLLAQEQASAPKIFAYLPGAITAAHPQSVTPALAIASITPEPSGDDQSYFLFMLEEMHSTSGLYQRFGDAGLEATFLNHSNQPPQQTVLVRVDGFHDTQSDAIQTVINQLQPTQFYWLGAHPVPIDLTDAS